MYRILTLNNISAAGLERFARDRYEVASQMRCADAVLVRSQDLHGFEWPTTLKAVARAGAGVNNIPVEALSARGVPVFNTPGANANAVKELVLAALLAASRNLFAAWDYARGLRGEEAAIHDQVEAAKRRFVGRELPGRTLGVIGLGAVGVQVANAAASLGMRVVGFDKQITVKRAWQLTAEVQQAASVGDLLRQSDVVTLHVPMTESTRGLMGAEHLAMMREGSMLLNFAREGVVNEQSLVAALDAGRLALYVCDFPSARLLAHERAISLPHIGASTVEAEQSCARMAVDQLREFLEDGNIRNSVNFPEVEMPRNGGCRLAVVNVNVPNMLGQISTALANAGLNIVDMLNKSREQVAYTLIDVSTQVPAAVLAGIAGIEGVLSVRLAGEPGKP